MKIRALLWFTAIASSILGAVMVYLVLSVPNDLRADSLMKEARKDLEAKKTDAAREKLSKIVQQYPRTDAAAAATVALVSIGVSERARLEKEIVALRTRDAQQTRLIGDLQKSVTEIKNAPPKTVTVTAPAPKPKPKPPAKKPTRRTRRRR
jgi:hypothetical protein